MQIVYAGAERSADAVAAGRQPALRHGMYSFQSRRTR